MKFNNYNKNIMFTCSAHGKEQYLKIQKLGSKDPTQTYVWFEDKNIGVERMWVKVVKGNKEKGSGVLINTPVKLTELKYGDYVEFKKQKDNIIYAGNIFGGPFCECCGDTIHDETGIKKAKLN